MMTRCLMVAVGLGGLFLAAGCGDKPKEPPADDGQAGAPSASGGSSPVGGSSAKTTSSVITGPAITSAPAEWERPADCGGIGDSCAGAGILGCGTGSSCQLEGYVCIPALKTGATAMPSKSAERPYCAAYTCMTFEEASCFCTGDAAKTNKNCATPSQLAGLCVGQGESCATSSCCAGLSCAQGAGTAKTCEKSCKTSADCETGCCTDLRDSGELICAAASACTNPCKKTAETCTPGTSSTPSDCCQGSCVQSSNPNYSGCRPLCTTNADCVKTGCCMPFSNSTTGFCVDALFCSCAGVDEACGTIDTPACCDGTRCVGGESGGFFCHKSCTADSDCDTGCCGAVAGVDYKVCNDPGYCGYGS